MEYRTYGQEWGVLYETGVLRRQECDVYGDVLMVVITKWIPDSSGVKPTYALWTGRFKVEKGKETKVPLLDDPTDCAE